MGYHRVVALPDAGIAHMVIEVRREVSPVLPTCPVPAIRTLRLCALLAQVVLHPEWSSSVAGVIGLGCVDINVIGFGCGLLGNDNGLGDTALVLFVCEIGTTDLSMACCQASTTGSGGATGACGAICAGAWTKFVAACTHPVKINQYLRLFKLPLARSEKAAMVASATALSPPLN